MTENSQAAGSESYARALGEQITPVIRDLGSGILNLATKTVEVSDTLGNRAHYLNLDWREVFAAMRTAAGLLGMEDELRVPSAPQGSVEALSGQAG